MPTFLASSTNKKVKQMDSEKIKVFFIALEQKGVKEIQIGYDGSGDSGSVNSVTFYDHNDDEIELKDFESKAEDIGYHILSRYYDVDWYNNEGGYGTVNINLADKTWDIDGYYRETTSVEAPADGDLKDVIETIIG